MNNSIFEKIKVTNIEDIILLTYFFTIIDNLYSNYLERDYIKNNNIRSRNLFRQINLYVLVIAFFIYLYFVFLSYKSIRNLRSNATQKKVFLTNLTLISALLFLIAGALNIFIQKNSIYDDEIGLI